MLFSIIIPVYNGASFLEKCIESVFSQTCDDYEIIVIDDGSSDNSYTVVADLAVRYPAIICDSITHSGAGAARNAGLNKATGEYVLFLDADDYWIDNGLLETLGKRIKQCCTDVYMFQMCKVTERGSELLRYSKPDFIRHDEIVKMQDVYYDLVRDGQSLASACNKCIRRELLIRHCVKFREDIYVEDIDWVLHLFSCTESICLLNIKAYAYTQHRNTGRSMAKKAPNDLASTIELWSEKLKTDSVPHAASVAGLIAFEYGICMGSNHLLSSDKRKSMKNCAYLLNMGIDKKTRLIACVYRLVGYSITCCLIRIYLCLRRIGI